MSDAIQRARALLEMRRPADAEREARGVLATEPHHVTGHAFLALALVEQGRAAEAITEADEAVRLAPDAWFPHYVAGQVLYRARQTDRALGALEIALSLSPEYAPTWELLARTQLLRGEWPRVVEAAGRGLALDPEDSDLAGLLAQGLIMLRDPGSLEAAARAVRLDPESATAHLVLGRAQLAFGDARLAADAFREVLRLDPGFDPARDLLVTALKRRNPVYRGLERLAAKYRGGWRMVFLLPAIPPLIAVFVLIAVLHWAAWVAEGLTTLRLARSHLLERAESRLALTCCALLAAGVSVLVLGIALGLPALGTAGVALMALVTPVQEAAHTSAPAGRAILYAWAALVLLTLTLAAVRSWPSIALLAVYAALATIWPAAGVRRALRA
ncbi:tetratricopeptide repeat protein [Nonomuraea sediminis]|uniref:tetratricopeptide repeat protein n=1 Tax=Nonomuraea sediminis TaxID=2835864 RepID=UPI001BDBD985|nr:tetratricopeptide repeat protein [Nonomuraea sediminis]